MHGVAVWAVALTILVTSAPAAADNTKSRAAAQEHKKAQKKTRSSVEKPFGREGDARKVKRVINVDLSDAMRFFPSEIRIKRGDTVRFAARNSGQTPHAMVLGTMDELKKHAQHMRAQHAEMTLDEPYVAHVAPGETGRIVWQFTRAGEFYYGCLVPGHFEAGMIGTIVVR